MGYDAVLPAVFIVFRQICCRLLSFEIYRLLRLLLSIFAIIKFSAIKLCKILTFNKCSILKVIIQIFCQSFYRTMLKDFAEKLNKAPKNKTEKFL